MTYHTSKQSRYAAIPAVVALSLLFSGAAITGAQALKRDTAGANMLTACMLEEDSKISSDKNNRYCCSASLKSCVVCPKNSRKKCYAVPYAHRFGPSIQSFKGGTVFMKR